jgi:para-nitrobenzyl esterase
MKHLSRRQFVTRSSLATAGLFVLSKTGFTHNLSLEQEYVIVDTTYGKIRGIRQNSVNIYKGIPYAGKVSGERRFRSPAPLEPWTGIRDALRLGNPSIQMPNQTYGIYEPEPAEDCLFLNIWTPANDHGKRPVMFYNHGGGFTHGSGGSVAQDGANLVRNFDVVVIETNHRLGLLGYLYLDEVAGDEYTGSGNMGLLDIVEGLKWVKDNIGEFGGDPDNVMIFGESGGGAKTSCLYAMPAAVPYFNKASIESGPGVLMTPRDMAAETTYQLLKEHSIDPKNWRKLLEVPTADLLEMQAKLPTLFPRPLYKKTIGIGPAGPGGFSPVVDGNILPENPFQPIAPEISRNKPLMVGWNEDEYTFFGMASNDLDSFNLDETGLMERLNNYFQEDAEQILNTYRKNRPDASPTDIYVEIASVIFAGLGSIYIAERKAAQNAAPAFLYNFGYKNESKIPGTDYPFGTPHAMDINFKFNNVVPGKESNSWTNGGQRPERFEASQNMAEMWTTFARTGRPGADGQPEWLSYTLPQRPVMRIDNHCEIIFDRNKLEREMWKSLGYM